MDGKICTHCNIKKSIEDFFNKYTECKICNSNRRLKRYYENKCKLSNQRKIYYEKREINYQRNKMLDIQIIKNYIDPMLNYKITQKHQKKSH